MHESRERLAMRLASYRTKGSEATPLADVRARFALEPAQAPALTSLAA